MHKFNLVNESFEWFPGVAIANVEIIAVFYILEAAL